MKAAAKCAILLRYEITETELSQYCELLRDFDAEKVEYAFDRCSKECLFMPRPAEILTRMPEEGPKPNAIIGKIVKDWTEAYDDAHVIHYFETDSGDRYTKIELKP